MSKNELLNELLKLPVLLDFLVFTFCLTGNPLSTRSDRSKLPRRTLMICMRVLVNVL